MKLLYNLTKPLFALNATLYSYSSIEPLQKNICNKAYLQKERNPFSKFAFLTCLLKVGGNPKQKTHLEKLYYTTRQLLKINRMSLFFSFKYNFWKVFFNYVIKSFDIKYAPS